MPTARKRELVVIAGAVARRPGAGGHAWVFLEYLLGFRRLGYDVLFVDRVEGDGEAGAAVLGDLLRPFDVEWALLTDRGTRGSARDVEQRLRSCVLLVNVMGYLRDPELLAAARRRVFLDIDPGFPQMWRELELADVFAHHDAYVTVGENVGRPECGIPTCGLAWIGTRPPVVLEQWPARCGGDRFTSVASWRGAFGPIEYRGKTYGLRVHEFRNFAELPRLVDAEFELALEIDPVEVRDLELLRENGWRLIDPIAVAGDTDAYRNYVQSSKAEFMVAKNMYVDTNSGWFSDRSACYLASGKPVLAQDTGIRDRYPTGEGLLVFSTLDEAVAGVEAIQSDYNRHSRAAREIAAEYFDSDKVLLSLLEKVGAG